MCVGVGVCSFFLYNTAISFSGGGERVQLVIGYWLPIDTQDPEREGGGAGRGTVENT